MILGRHVSLPGFIASAVLRTQQVSTSSWNCRHWTLRGTCCPLPHRRHSLSELWLGQLTVVFAKVGTMFPQIIIFVRGSVFCHPDVTTAIHFTPTLEGQTPRNQSVGSLHVPNVWSWRLRDHRRQTTARSPWTQSRDRGLDTWFLHPRPHGGRCQDLRHVPRLTRVPHTLSPPLV